MRVFLTVIWFALAIWFLWASSTARSAVQPWTPIPADAIAVGPRRAPLVAAPPRVKIGGLMQRCVDCHGGFTSLDRPGEEPLQHRHIRLDHGLNDRCYNCHDQRDREHLVLHDGTLIGFASASQLCSKCHGTVYRDWEHGMHGRSTGSWDPQSPERGRLGCVECHDPHAPAFPAYQPLPGPRGEGAPVAETEAGAQEHAAPTRNPLERWKQPRAGASAREHVDPHPEERR